MHKLVVVCLALMTAVAAHAGEGERFYMAGLSYERPVNGWRTNVVFWPPARFQGNFIVSYNTDVPRPPSVAFIQVWAGTPIPFPFFSSRPLRDIIGTMPLTRPKLPPNDLPGALAALKTSIESQRAHPLERFKLLSFQMAEVAVDRTTCVRTHVVMEDRSTKGHEGEVFVLTDEYLTCPHPDRPSYDVEFWCSSRIAPGAPDFPLGEELDRLQKSLRFTPLSND